MQSAGPTRNNSRDSDVASLSCLQSASSRFDPASARDGGSCLRIFGNSQCCTVRRRALDPWMALVASCVQAVPPQRRWSCCAMLCSSKYCKRWKAHRLDAYMLLCLGKAIEESASTCVAVGGKAFSISNSWLMIICQYIIMCRKISKHVQQRS